MKKVLLIWAVGLVLVFTFMFIIIQTESTDTPAEDTIQTTIEDTEGNTNTITTPDSSTSSESETSEPETTTETNEPESATETVPETEKPDNSVATDEKVQMVWVTESGKRYHSRSTCSNMKSPRQIPLEDAKDQGYTACQKCH